MRTILLILAIYLFVSCGAVVNVDYEKDTNFAPYKSYNFYDIDSGLSELDDKRIMRITDSIMLMKGFVKDDSPSFLINFFANEIVSNSRNTIGVGVGGGGGNVGVGVSGGFPIGGRIINQRLTLDFVDGSTDSLFWQAVCDGEIKEKASPRQREAYLVSVINKALNKYPPK